MFAWLTCLTELVIELTHSKETWKTKTTTCTLQQCLPYL